MVNETAQRTLARICYDYVCTILKMQESQAALENLEYHRMMTHKEIEDFLGITSKKEGEWLTDILYNLDEYIDLRYPGDAWYKHPAKNLAYTILKKQEELE